MTNPSLTTGLADLAPRARIREAALRLYAEHGTQATSIRMVAEEAGMSAGAVMHHFKSKDELAEAVQHAVVAKIREVVSGVGLDQPPPVAARARRQAFDQLIADNPFIAGYIRRVTLEGGAGRRGALHRGVRAGPQRDAGAGGGEHRPSAARPGDRPGAVPGGQPGAHRLRPAGRADARPVAVGSGRPRAVPRRRGRPADPAAVQRGARRSVIAREGHPASAMASRRPRSPRTAARPRGSGRRG